MSTIHPTAIVSDKAKIGSNISIGPYALVEDNVEIGNDCEIGPHAVIYDGARIGSRIKIKQGAAVANVPQDLKFANEESVFIINDDTVVREFAALHRGTKETGFSLVGKNCLLMAYSHVPHDCTVGDNCIIANSVQIGGHSVVEDFVIIGGLTGVHQFSLIGEHSMVGGTIFVNRDVPPYILAGRTPAHYIGLNIIGLRRRGFKSEDIETIKQAYALLYDKGMNVSQAVKVIDDELGSNVYVKKILEFIGKSKRGIVTK
ncbi:MAG: acyl-ACP--UDP-N-acetylglucosamine O-acyltransferase [Ignavibacteria bacterium]|nr:acyl-ACP--UDP-N-acetylglucosamine O-acyltransferase [Ignavibacteria bacterium]MBT8392737.1 acyl-ACP--UDP-N-acetylglucosamine O-acyltransferase [Ignavibacteria bacterium]